MKKFVILSMLFALLISQSAFAKDPFHWEFINVEIDLQENGDMLIKETQQYVFDAPYSDQRYRWIPLDGIGGIADITVTEDGKPVNIRTNIESNRQWIKWTKAVNPPDRHTFVLSYRVIGGLTIHEDGDQLYWTAIFKDHAVPINKAKVTVRLPTILAGHIQSHQSAIANKLNDRTVEFVHEQPLLAGQGLVSSVTFSHGILNVPEVQKQVARSEEKFEPNLWRVVWIMGTTFIIGLFIMLFSDDKYNKNSGSGYNGGSSGDGGDGDGGGSDGGGGG
jgi:uncharacterized membrane protein YgcG